MEAEVIMAIRGHFPNLFEPLQREHGRYFNADNIPRIMMGGMDRVLQLELWDFALEHRAYQAYHSLAILTDNDFLEEALYTSVQKHEFWAIASLIARLSAVTSDALLRHVNCAAGCSDCSYIRSALIDQLDLKNDWAYVRRRIREAKTRNLWGMWRPIMHFSPNSDVILKRIEIKATRGWSKVFAAVFFIKLWRSWVQRQLDPDSSFVKKVAQRWKK
jgi:hypothetical protein